MALESSVKTDASTWKKIVDIWTKKSTRWARAQNVLVKVGPDTWKQAFPGLPKNMIVMYEGSLPSNMQICDGSNGTPNLVDSFPKISKSQGSQTGSDSHTTGSGSSGTGYSDDNDLNWGTDYGASERTHTHNIPSHKHGEASSIPEYVSLQLALLEEDLLPKTEIYVFFIDILNRGIPRNWEKITSYDGRYIRGSTSSEFNTGGSESHSHYKSMDTGSGGGGESAKANYGAEPHSHPINHYASGTVNPPYISTFLLTPEPFAGIVSGITALFSGDLPQGWISLYEIGADGCLIRISTETSLIRKGSATHEDYSDSAKTGKPNNVGGAADAGAEDIANEDHKHTMNGHSHGSASSYPVNTPVVIAIRGCDFIGQLHRWTFDSNGADSYGVMDMSLNGSVAFENVNGENVVTLDQEDTQYLRAKRENFEKVIWYDQVETILGRFESSVTNGEPDACIAERKNRWRIEIDQSVETEQTVRFYFDGAEIASTIAHYGNPYQFGIAIDKDQNIDCFFNGKHIASHAGSATFDPSDDIDLVLGRDASLSKPARGHFNDWMDFNIALRPVDVALIDQDYDQWVDAGMGELTDYVEPQDDSSTYIDPS